MPGYMFVLGECYTCHKMIMFSASHVPSLPANLTTTGEKEPVCRECIEFANPHRVENGLPEIVIHPDAYLPEEVC